MTFDGSLIRFDGNSTAWAGGFDLRSTQGNMGNNGAFVAGTTITPWGTGQITMTNQKADNATSVAPQLGFAAGSSNNSVANGYTLANAIDLVKSGSSTSNFTITQTGDVTGSVSHFYILTGVISGSTTNGRTLTFANGAGSPTLNTANYILTNANTYLAGTVIGADTTLQLGNGGATGSLTGTSAISNSGNVTVNRNNAFTQATDLNGKAISGTGSFTQAGAGTTTLSATNTYTGTTTISAGTLIVAAGGSIASGSAVTVGANGTLAGSGTVNGSTAVYGTLSPGNSPGSMATGSQTWFNGGDFNWQVLDVAGAAGTGYDTFAVTGTLNLASLTAGGFSVNLWSLSSILPDVNGNALNFNDANNYQWTLVSTSSGVTGFDAANFAISAVANNGAAGFSNTFTGSFSVTADANNLYLNYTAVPEPSTFAMLLGGAGMLAMLRRRRR